MRGQQHFRKIIQRMPSGKFRWAINGHGEALLDYGIARSRREAKTQAMSSERQLLVAYQRAPTPVPASPAYSLRNREAAECAQR